ncbi:unnamed protein product [Amoebophrya sp. A25]|nr:unnamed protein product [Amoebophrya sp. A25]|eukprot:GSA25T00022069001.1
MPKNQKMKVQQRLVRRRLCVTASAVLQLSLVNGLKFSEDEAASSRSRSLLSSWTRTAPSRTTQKTSKSGNAFLGTSGQDDDKHIFPIETHHRGCYKFKQEAPSTSTGGIASFNATTRPSAEGLDVLFRSSGGPFSVKDCAIQCESEKALPKYALLSEGGDICECAEDLGSEYDISTGGAECDSRCTAAGDTDSPCGSFDGEYKSVYWWSRCTEEDDNPLNNRCKCAHGVAQTGEHCVEDYAQSCASCDAGFTLDGEECVRNACECPHGTGSAGEACPVDAEIRCEQCFEGYHLIPRSVLNATSVATPQTLTGPSPMTCAVNECSCAGGVGATGADCPSHGAAFCSNCTEPGFFMKAPGECEEKQCVCDLTTGTAAKGVECPAPHANVCSVCHEGYHLDGHSCVKNVCNCPHGEHAEGGDCPVDGALKCTTCGEGFDMLNGECTERICTCPAHGDPAVGAHCPANGTMACERCDYHYELNAATRTCDRWTPKYVGCFEDNGDRDLPNLVMPVRAKTKGRMEATPESCDIWCAEYKYFAIQAGHECWCGNKIDYTSKPESDCKACKHDSSLKCGAGWRNSVYEHEPTVKYIGCYEDQGERAMEMHVDKHHTFQSCMETCTDPHIGGGPHKYFALQNGKECACGADFARYGRKADSECKYECAEGNSLSGKRDDGYCGGGWRNAVYEVQASTAVGGGAFGDEPNNLGPGWTMVAGIGYRFAPGYEGATSCPLGSDLATVELPSQMRFVKQLVGGPRQNAVALGFTDAITEGEWAHTEHGLPILHEGQKGGLEWGRAEPNDDGAGEDCAVLKPDGKFNDVKCSKVSNGDYWLVCSKRV